MTPAAFLVFLGKLTTAFSTEEVESLKRQFTAMEPMLTLGQALSASGECGACMDNTDGIGQSLSELSEASKCAFVVKQDALRIPGIVDKVCRTGGVRPLDIVFDGGADFSLVGTLRGEWTGERAKKRFGDDIEIIGFVAPGEGVWLEAEARTQLYTQVFALDMR